MNSYEKLTLMDRVDRPYFVTLGMFIIDEFSFCDENGEPTGRSLASQIGGGGTYAAIGARIWLPANQVGMVVDKGDDFPKHIEEQLLGYGSDMWMFRHQPGVRTTRALNSYKGDHRSFEYKTPRIRITPRDLVGTKFANPATLHFICSPARASVILSEAKEVSGWSPITIYEPIPDRCIPAELPALRQILRFINILSPNAEEALTLLSLPLPATQASIEEAASKLLEFGVGENGNGWVVIRSGAMGAYVKKHNEQGVWVEAFWNDQNSEKIVDVTGAGNSFLGGLAAGLLLAEGDVHTATFYATVSASFTIEQEGLPRMTQASSGAVYWNNTLPEHRLAELRKRHGK